MDLKFIVTGTPRSGTVFMARLLTSLGIPCGHESYFSPWTKVPLVLNKPDLSWTSCHDRLTRLELPTWVDVECLSADSSNLAVPFLDHEPVKCVPLVHVIRNPLHVISSMVIDNQSFLNTNSIWDKFRSRHAPEAYREPTPIGRACMFWIMWNSRISSYQFKRPYCCHRVEDLDDADLFKFLGQQQNESTFRNISINTNRKRDRDFNINDIPNQYRSQLIDIASKYGYNIGFTGHEHDAGM